LKEKILKFTKCSEADYILGIEIEKKCSNYLISQTQLIKDSLQKSFNVDNIRKTKKNSLLNSNKINEKNDIYFW